MTVDHLPDHPEDDEPSKFDPAYFMELTHKDWEAYLESWLGSEEANESGLTGQDLATMGGVPW